MQWQCKFQFVVCALGVGLRTAPNAHTTNWDLHCHCTATILTICFNHIRKDILNIIVAFYVLIKGAFVGRIVLNNNNVWRLFTFSKPGLTITQITATALKNHHVQLEVKWGVEYLFSSGNYPFVFEAVSVLKNVVMENLCACVDFFVLCIHFNCYDY